MKNLSIKISFLSLAMLVSFVAANATIWYTGTATTATMNGNNSGSTGWTTTSGGTPSGTQTIATGDNIVIQGATCSVTVVGSTATVYKLTMAAGSSITTTYSLFVNSTLTSNGGTVTYIANGTSKIYMESGSTVNNFVQSASGTPGGIDFNGPITLSGTNIFTAIAKFPATNAIVSLAASSNNSFTAGVSGMSSTKYFTCSSTATLSIGGSGSVYFDQSTPGTTNTLSSFIISSGAITLSSTVNVTSVTLSGALTNSGDTLAIANGGTITMAGGSLTAAPIFGSTVNVVYNDNPTTLTTGYELPSTTTVLNNLTINTSTPTPGVLLDENIVVNGRLTINSGCTLGIKNGTLAINGSVAGTGTLYSSVACANYISIWGSNSGSVGTLLFAPSPNNVFQSLYINLTGTSSSVGLGNDLVLSDITGNALNIQSGTLNLNGHNLTVTGNITTVAGTGMVTGSNTAGLNLTNATGNLCFTPSTRALNNLYFSGNTTATLDSATSIYGLLTLKSNTKLTTQGYLTLISNSSGTAALDSISGTLSGNVTVQRYIPAKTIRKFDFIGAPISGATIRNAWQQQIYITGNGTGGIPCGSTTGDGGTTDKYNSNGFDATQNNTPSMYTYANSPINGSHYVSVTKTDTTHLYPGTGYCINIRGNRNSSTVTCANQLETTTPTAPEAVTLSATGTAQTGKLTVHINTPSTNKYSLIANPYPCPISFTAFQDSNTTRINPKTWTYCPTGNGNYTTFVPASGSIPAAITNAASGYNSTNGDYIASGQAFFVEAANTTQSSDSVIFNEVHKVSGGTIPNTNLFGTTSFPMIRVGITATDSSVLDETLVRFCSQGTIDYNTQYDAVSFGGGSQVIVTLKASKSLAIATLPINFTTDTVQLGISSTSVGSFNLLFSDYDGLSAAQSIILVDKYLSTNQDVRSSPVYNFNITSDTASYGNNRFEIVFTNTSTLPVKFISIATNENNGAVAVKWQVTNETGVSYYEVDRSIDGINFTSINNTKAKGLANYEIEDNHLPIDASTLYYRIKSIGVDGTFKYSSIAKLTIHNSQLTTFSIYPNPVKDVLNIDFNQSDNNKYSINITSIDGKQVYKNENIVAINNHISINANNLSSGVYLLDIIKPDGEKWIKTIVISH
jgi:hypothetical protein